MISIGWKMSWNCGMPKSNSSWKVDSAMSMPPGHQMRRRPLTHHTSRSSVPSRFIARMPSTCRTAIASSAMTAPPMSMRCVGPQSVTSWPKSRCHWSSSGKPSSEKLPRGEHQHAAERGVPVARDLRRTSGLPPSRGRHIAKKPAMTMPYSPARMK